jgi:PAS domain S-box-containing protein
LAVLTPLTGTDFIMLFKKAEASPILPNRQASILLGDVGMRLMATLLPLIIIFTFILSVFNVYASRPWYGSVSGFVVSLFLLILIRAGHVKLSMNILLWGFALSPIFWGMRNFGANAPGLFLVPVATMAASWLLTVRQCLCMTISSIILCIVVYQLTVYGIFKPEVPLNSITLIGLIVSVLAAALIGLFGAGVLRKEFNRVNELTLELTAKAEHLQHSETSFSVLFRSSALPSITGYIDGRILDVNDMWLLTYGFLREEVIGRIPIEVGNFGNAEERKFIREKMKKRASVVGMPIQLRIADGSYRTFLLSISCFELADGWHYVSSALDQTDRLAAEQVQYLLNVELENRVATRTAELTSAIEELKRTQAQLVQSEKLASLGSMVAGVAHEINTPVGNAILVTSALTQKQHSFERAINVRLSRTELVNFLNSVREVTDLVSLNMQRVARLVSSFKQVAVDQTNEYRSCFDLREVAAHAFLRLASDLRLGVFSFENRIPEGIQMDSYPIPLGTVLVNMLDNTYRHGFEGRDQGQIILQAELIENRRVRISLIDDGVGIAEPHIKRIFEPFFTAKSHHTGCGLGLTIAHNIVTAMLGGVIEVRSILGQSTEIWIEIPLSVQASQ